MTDMPVQKKESMVHRSLKQTALSFSNGSLIFSVHETQQKLAQNPAQKLQNIAKSQT